MRVCVRASAFLFSVNSLGSLDMVINSFCFHLVYGISSLHSLRRTHKHTSLYYTLHSVCLWTNMQCNPISFSPISSDPARSFHPSIPLHPFAFIVEDKTLKTIMLFVYMISTIVVRCSIIIANCGFFFIQINVSNWYVDCMTDTRIANTQWTEEKNSRSFNKLQIWTLAELISVESKMFRNQSVMNSNCKPTAEEQNNGIYCTACAIPHSSLAMMEFYGLRAVYREFMHTAAQLIQVWCFCLMQSP